MLTFGQVVIGVALGAQLTSATLRAVAGDWLAITVVTVATLVISLAAGLLLSRATGLDRPDRAARTDRGRGERDRGDERRARRRRAARGLHAVPARADRRRHRAAGRDRAVRRRRGPALAPDAAAPASRRTCVHGRLRRRRHPDRAPGADHGRQPAGAARDRGRAVVSGITDGAHVPDRIQDLGFAAIGLQVGLRFTVATIRQAGRLLPAVVAALAGMIVACGGLAVLVLLVTDVSFSDAYLATTPGGLYAVLAVAVGGGGNVGFVLAVQALRLFAMILAAPPLVRLITRSHERDFSGTTGS